MAEVTRFDLVSLVTPPSSVPAELTDAWSVNLQAQSNTKIKARYDLVAKDPAAWNTNVAAASSVRWAPMLNSDFVSRSGRTSGQITGMQYEKLAASHQNAIEGHDRAFTVDPDTGRSPFRDAVQAKSSNWARGVAHTLGVTGNRAGGKRGPGVIHTLALAGDPSFQRDLGPGDVMSGSINGNGTDPIVPVMVRQQFKAALMGALTQMGVLIGKGVMSVAEGNERLLMVLNGFLNSATYAIADFDPSDPGPFAFNSGSYIIYEAGDTGLVLHSHIVTGAP